MAHDKPIILGQTVRPSKVELAKLLRKNMTIPEKMLWKKVRRNGLGGFHFRRQQIIAGFVVDFYCHEVRLAVELDGPVHDKQASYDQARDQAILAEYEVVVLRIRNERVTESLDVVCDQILRDCKTRLSELFNNAVLPSQ